MTRAEVHKALDQIKAYIHKTFTDPARLEQFDAHVATVGMVVDHLHDEASKTGEGK